MEWLDKLKQKFSNPMSIEILVAVLGVIGLLVAVAWILLGYKKAKEREK